MDLMTLLKLSLAGWPTAILEMLAHLKRFSNVFSYQDWVFACVHKPLQSGDAGDNIIFIDKQIL